MSKRKKMCLRLRVKNFPTHFTNVIEYIPRNTNTFGTPTHLCVMRFVMLFPPKRNCNMHSPPKCNCVMRPTIYVLHKCIW